MKFLHFTTFYPPYSFGGDAMYLYRLCHALADAGHQVDVVHCIDSYHLLHPGEPEVEFTPHAGVTTHGLRSGYGRISPLLSHQTGRPLLKSRAIQRILDQDEYDVVHYHNISLLGPKVLSLRPRSNSAVKLYTAHEHWLVCPTHVLWKYNRRPCEQPSCLRCTVMASRPPQLWRYTGQLGAEANHVDRFVAPSRFTANMHHSRGFPRKLGVLPYFTDRSDTDWQTPSQRPQERPYFLFVGRLETIKGVQRLIEVWPQVNDADLLVVGSGTFEKGLRNQAADNPHVRFLGARSQRELGSLYYHAEACIVPSLTYETFGIVIIEAFARKTPVIAHALGALEEVVEQSRGGLLYRTSEELLSAIRSIRRSKDDRNRLGSSGYDAFMELWTREAHLQMYYDLINNASLERFGESKVVADRAMTEAR